MSKAGLTILLSLVILLVSGVSQKTFAHEKLTTISLNGPKKVSVCNTPLQTLLITSGTQCEMKTISQRDFVAKLEPKRTNTLSYATEPTYYKPQPTITLTPETPSTSPIPQTPVNMLGANGANNNSDQILEMINAYRTKIGKPQFIKEEKLCSLALIRSTELHGELFEGKGYLHSGLYNRNLPYYITENAKYGSNEAGTVQWWLNSPVHRNTIEADYTYSCGACNGTQCSQLFTSYKPKFYPKTTITPSPTLIVAN